MKTLEEKPFALLGINSDRDKTKLKERMKEEHITWRSWWDNGDTNGPIASQWNVKGWPTIYILDEKGIIRYKSLGGDEAAIDATLRDLLSKLGHPIEFEGKAEKPERK
ncbi:MAG: TlpA family protein disulfide reductase [Isosphaeraceae bacterium]|nr:TlpA family protein disulfide reductase [Isosphaeraceae bacterium]